MHQGHPALGTSCTRDVLRWGHPLHQEHSACGLLTPHVGDIPLLMTLLPCGTGDREPLGQQCPMYWGPSMLGTPQSFCAKEPHFLGSLRPTPLCQCSHVGEPPFQGCQGPQLALNPPCTPQSATPAWG